MEDDTEGAVQPVNGNAAHSHAGSIERQHLLFCERFVEFLIDLMSQAPTRRYCHALLEDKAVLIKCRMSALFAHEQGKCSWKTFFFMPSNGLVEQLASSNVSI